MVQEKMISNRKLNICLLLPCPHNADTPVMGITEIYSIYGRYMPRFGHQITWIAPSRGKIRDVQEEFFNKVRVYTIPYSKYSLLLLRIFNRLLFSFRQAKFVTTIFKNEKSDIIQARNGIFDGLLAIYIKRRYKVPFVFQYSIPLIGFDEYEISRRLWLKFQNYILNIILHEADLIFPISKWMQEDLIKNGISGSKMMLFPSSVDLDIFSFKTSGDDVRNRYDLNNSQVIIYVGTMDKSRRLDIAIRAFAKVKAEKQDVKLLMVGDGDDRINLERTANELDVENSIVFTGQVSYFDTPKFIAPSDIGIVPVPPLSGYKVSVSTKLREYMAMGKAVIANKEIPDHKEAIEQSGGGILVLFNVGAFANAMIELLNDSERTKEMGRRGREWVAKNQSYETLARELEGKYFEILNKFSTCSINGGL